MSDPTDRVADDELHAFVDAQLDPTRLPVVLAWLQAHPDAAERVLQWQAQRVQLRQLARAIDPGETPAALTAVVTRAAAARRRRLLWQQAAAVVLLVATEPAGAAPDATSAA
ncbi:MAG TPA: hypothetical protein PLG77_09700, partial [Burkholderiaceae bacterium]|nr:hypothetical protein [Burkholderiaceae bacterium]